MIQAIAAVVSAIVGLITIFVLVSAKRAANRQAKAAERQAEAAQKLIDVTDRQIATSTEQADAAREQVALAKRQITESLRPIIIIRHDGPNPPGLKIDLVLKNEGAGVALDVWWMYGNFGDNPNTISQRNRVAEGILAPQMKRSLTVETSLALSKGVLIAYESLAGVSSGTRITWQGGKDSKIDYYPDMNEWTRSLLGRVLGSRPS